MVIDLTHTMRPGMPVYPGTESPQFVNACGIARNGFAEKKMTFFSHTGTHMDVPAHIIRGGATVDQLSPDRFYGKACMVDVRPKTGRAIDMDMIRPFEGLMRDMDFVLLRSGWSRFWDDDAYFQGYPVLTPDTAAWISVLGLKGLGIDMISVDKEGSTDFPIHRTLLEQDTLIIENLTNLHAVPAASFAFWCLPLKIENGDGSPVRAVAVVK